MYIVHKIFEENVWKQSSPSCSCLASTYYHVHIVKRWILSRFNRETAAEMRHGESSLLIKMCSIKQSFLLLLVMFIRSFKRLAPTKLE